jgi:hypothetical protein
VSARRIAAIGALLLGLGGFGLAVVVAVQEFPRGLIALACVALAAAAAWYGVLRRGAVRVAGLSVGVLGLGAAILLLLSDRLLEQVLVVAALVLSGACARAAFGLRVHLPPVAAPPRPVLFFNPKSGGGKAEESRSVRLSDAPIQDPAAAAAVMLLVVSGMRRGEQR